MLPNGHTCCGVCLAVRVGNPVAITHSTYAVQRITLAVGRVRQYKYRLRFYRVYGAGGSPESRRGCRAAVNDNNTALFLCTGDTGVNPIFTFCWRC